MIGRLLTIEELIDRLDVDDLFEMQKPVMEDLVHFMVDRMVKLYMDTQVWERMPTQLNKNYI